MVTDNIIVTKAISVSLILNIAYKYNKRTVAHLIVGEVSASDGGEGAAGWPGEDVLTLPGCVDPGLGEDRDHISSPASTLQLGRVREAELVDRSHCRHQHHHTAPTLVHTDPGQEGSIHKPVLDPVTNKVKVEADLSKLEAVPMCPPVQSSIGQYGAVGVIFVTVAS